MPLSVSVIGTAFLSWFVLRIFAILIALSLVPAIPDSYKIVTESERNCIMSVLFHFVFCARLLSCSKLSSIKIVVTLNLFISEDSSKIASLILSSGRCSARTEIGSKHILFMSCFAMSFVSSALSSSIVVCGENFRNFTLSCSFSEEKSQP